MKAKLKPPITSKMKSETSPFAQERKDFSDLIANKVKAHKFIQKEKLDEN